MDNTLFPDIEPVPAKVFVLNPGQQKAHDWLVDFILNPKHEFNKVLLDAHAGYGKTFLVNRAIETVRQRNRQIAFGMTAPTHKAVRQLKKHSELKGELDFGTIHRYLVLKEVQKVDPKDSRKMYIAYEPDFNPDRIKPIDEIDVLILDETSMLGENLYEYIEDYARGRGNSLKIIFLGDSLQIPPVRGKNEPYDPLSSMAIPFSEAQRSSRRIAHLTLDEPVRQSVDNPIFAYATALREQYKNQAISHTFSLVDGKGVEPVPRNRAALDLLFTKYFCTPEFHEDPDYVKVVAWRNDSVNYFNDMIRKLMYQQETLPRIVMGEKLVLNKPIIRKKKVILASNEELEVTSISELTVPVKYKLIERPNAMQQAASDGVHNTGIKQCEEMFKIYRCGVVTAEKNLFMIDVLHEDDMQRFEDLRKELEVKAKKTPDMFDRKEMWKQFFALDEPFANVNYNYAISCHKSQGSTYNYCISMEWDIDQNWMIEERNRIKYVAATRAKFKLFIVK